MAFTKILGPGIHTLANFHSHNINSSGIITATKFVGPLGAGVTGDGANFAGIVTCTGLDVNGDGHVSGALTITGNVNIGGTITYTDVTNVDAIGIITAQNGINISGNGLNVISGVSTFAGDIDANADIELAGNLAVTGVSTFTAAANFDNAITVDGSVGIADSIVHLGNTDTSIRFPSDDTFAVETAGSERVRIDSTGSLLFNQTQNKILVNTSDGSDSSWLNINGGGDASQSRGAGLALYGNENSGNEGRLWLLAGNSGNANGEVVVRTAGADRLWVTSTGLVTQKGTWSNTYTGAATTQCGYQAQNLSDVIGSYAALRLTAGTNSPATAQLTSIRTGAGQNDFTVQLEKSNTAFEALRIDSDGHILPGTAGTQNLGSTSKEWGDLYFANSKGLKLGSSQVGDLYNDGTDTYFRNSVSNGQTLIRSGGNIWISDYSGNHRAGFKDNSAVDLYFDIENHSTAKLSTTATGVSVHGEVAATQDYPDFQPTLDFNFAKVKKLDSRFTYYRDSVATYVDENGLVRVVGHNEPRFDHDPVTRECKGLLIEDQRISRLTGSSHSDPSGLYKQTDRGDIIKGPDGVENSAREFTVNADGGTSGSTTIWANEAIGIADATSFSFFVKITRGSTMAFRLFDNNNNLESEKWTISGGAITDGYSYATVVQSDPGSTEGTTSYELYPNGWVKCKWEGASGSGNATSYIQLYIWDHASSTGTNIGYAIWGFQVENGVFCTSTIYKPTAAAATRTADFVSITGDDHSDSWNSVEGTYFIDYKPLEDVAGNGVIIGSKRGSNGSGYPWPLYRHDAANSNIFKSYDLDNSIVSISSAWADRRETWALGFNGTNGSIARNGSQLITNNTNMKGLIDANELWLGSSGTGSLYSMHVKRFMYYSKRISDSQLVTLTS